jgi:hypothetical protein
MAVCCILAATSQAHATVYELTTADHRFDTGVDNQGWWSTTISNSNSNDNYYCGLNSNGPHRSFFTFFAPSWGTNETIVGAVLAAPRGASNSASAEVQLFDVATAVAILNNNAGTHSAIYEDLGSGLSYGSVVVSGSGTASQAVQIPLNAQGMAALQASAGTYFSIGARLANESNHLFGDTDIYTARLIVTTVPEPKSVVLTGLSVIGLTMLRPRRSPTTAVGNSACYG